VSRGPTMRTFTAQAALCVSQGPHMSREAILATRRQCGVVGAGPVAPLASAVRQDGVRDTHPAPAFRLECWEREFGENAAESGLRRARLN
jgi:hypothetical protein